MQNYLSFIVGINLVWTLLLTGFTSYIFMFFNKLKKGAPDSENLITSLSKILNIQKDNTKNIENINSKLKDILEADEGHVQKLGFLRYNPFSEVGGDHSFSVALLDGKDTGIVLTALHTRDRTRIYVKDINKGKSKIELSENEKKVLSKAMK